MCRGTPGGPCGGAGGSLTLRDINTWLRDGCGKSQGGQNSGFRNHRCIKVSSSSCTHTHTRTHGMGTNSAAHRKGPVQHPKALLGAFPLCVAMRRSFSRSLCSTFILCSTPLTFPASCPIPLFYPTPTPQRKTDGKVPDSLLFPDLSCL